MAVPSARGRMLVGQLVVDTKYVCARRPGAPAPYYEIHLAPDTGGDAKRFVLVTRDDALYSAALDAEDTGERVEAEWAPAQRADGRVVHQLLGLWRSV
jgi:hypothetical protein